MFRKTGLAALAAALSLASAPAFAASPVVGNWAAKINVMETTIESTITVAEAAGGAYTVEIKDGPMPGAPPEAAAMPSTISDVAVEGSKLSFKRKLTTPQGEMDLAYALTADGNALTGEINSSFGAIPLTATRQ